MRVLVTGSTGHVGGAIARHLTGAGHEVVGLSRAPAGGRYVAEHVSLDLGAPSAAAELDRLDRCEGVVHAAAVVDHDPSSVSVSLANCVGTQRVIAAAERWESALVYISGVTVIGRPTTVPVTEDHPADPPTAYHASKLYGEHLTTLAQRRGMAAASLRLTAPVGPGMPRRRILTVFVERALAGDALEVAGRGSRRQDYVDVRDVAAVVESSLERRAAGLFNVGAGTTVSNEELARGCVAVLGSDSEVVLGRTHDAEEGIAWRVSIDRAGRELGYRPHWSIDDAIAAVAEDLRGAPSSRLDGSREDHQ